jgi:hypothetical protein
LWHAEAEAAAGARSRNDIAFIIDIFDSNSENPINISKNY